MPAVLLLSACTATGTGTLPSNDQTQKANFGFSYDGNTTTFSGSYHDPRGQLPHGDGLISIVDVAFKGTGVMHSCTAADPACVGAPPTKGGCLVGEPSYTSQNPALPGSGLVFLLLCDLNGNGVPEPDLDAVNLQVDSGPYVGYRNAGTPSGNLTVKS